MEKRGEKATRYTLIICKMVFHIPVSSPLEKKLTDFLKATLMNDKHCWLIINKKESNLS
jgi:hypothetical protein